MVKNILVDHFGLLWNVDKPAMFGHFCLFYWCVFLGHPVDAHVWFAVLG